MCTYTLILIYMHMHMHVIRYSSTTYTHCVTHILKHTHACTNPHTTAHITPHTVTTTATLTTYLSHSHYPPPTHSLTVTTTTQSRGICLAVQRIYASTRWHCNDRFLSQGENNRGLWRTCYVSVYVIVLGRLFVVSCCLLVCLSVCLFLVLQ